MYVYIHTYIYMEGEGFWGGASSKETTCQRRRHKRYGLDLWVGKIPWRRAWQPTPAFLPGESPWTEEPCGLQSIESQSWTWLKWISTHAHTYVCVCVSIYMERYRQIYGISSAQSCLTLQSHESKHAGLSVHHQLWETTQTHVHWVGDAIQPSHALSSSSPPALNLCQNQGLFQWVSSSHQVDKVLEFQLQHQSFQWTPRTDLL